MTFGIFRVSRPCYSARVRPGCRYGSPREAGRRPVRRKSDIARGSEPRRPAFLTLPFPGDFSSIRAHVARSSPFVSRLVCRRTSERVERERKFEGDRTRPHSCNPLFGIALLTAGLVCAVLGPSGAALASTGDPAHQAQTTHTVTFESNGTIVQQATNAATVGDFLRERNVTVGPHDFVDPASDVPLSDGLAITYRAAVPVTIEVGQQTIAAVSSAQKSARCSRNSAFNSHPKMPSARAFRSAAVRRRRARRSHYHVDARRKARSAVENRSPVRLFDGSR